MSSIIHSQAADIPYAMTTTGFDLPGYRIVQSLGVVRGVVGRSRSVFGTIGAGLQTIFGGNISLFTELAERTRQQAFDTMLVQADMAGAVKRSRELSLLPYVVETVRETRAGRADRGERKDRDAEKAE